MIPPEATLTSCHKDQPSPDGRFRAYHGGEDGHQRAREESSPPNLGTSPPSPQPRDPLTRTKGVFWCQAESLRAGSSCRKRFLGHPIHSPDLPSPTPACSHQRESRGQGTSNIHPLLHSQGQGRGQAAAGGDLAKGSRDSPGSRRGATGGGESFPFDLTKLGLSPGPSLKHRARPFPNVPKQCTWRELRHPSATNVQSLTPQTGLDKIINK